MFLPGLGAATSPGGNLNAFPAYSQISFGSTWTANAIQPETRILTDANTGPLADLTYVVPEAYNGDHAQGGGNMGPEWVASAVNAIGESANWSDTAIFVTRVGQIDDMTYEPGSVLKFVEETFGLPSLGTTDV